MPDMLVRIKRGKKNFEVLVNEGLVPKYRDGKVPLSDVIVTPTVFTNASKATKASAEQLMSAFETDDVNAVIETILQKGEAQESAGERKEKADAKRREVINAIQKNYVMPDGSPLPVMRIENALDKLKPRIGLDQDAARQVEGFVTKLGAIMPLKRAKADMEAIISVPVHLSGAASAIVRKHAKVLRESYGLRAKYEVEVFSYDLLLKELTKLTDGDFDVNVTSAEASVAAAQDPAPASMEGGGGKGKKKKKGKAK